MIRELFIEDLSLWTCLWQSTAFVVLGLVAARLVRRRPARAYQVLLFAMMAAVAVPLLSAVVKHLDLGVFVATETELPRVPPEMALATSAPAPQARAMVISPPEFTRDEATVAASFSIPWRMVMLYGWMAATLVLLGRLIVTFLYGVHLVRRASGARCETVQETADRMGSKLGMACGLQVRADKRIRSPIVWCWSRRPILLVPDHGENPRCDWTGVVTHELAHRVRRDHITGLLAEVATSLLPWNPLMWVAKRCLVRLGEQACDDWVVAAGAPSEDYAESLLRFRPQRPMVFLPAVVHSKRGLAARVRRILSDACGNPRTGAKWAVAAGVTAISVSLVVAFAQARPAPTEAPAEQAKMPARSLQEAIESGDVAEVERLIAQGADVNARDAHGNTASHLLAMYGCRKQKIAQLLMANGADANAKNSQGLVPLHYAVSRQYTGHRDIVELLVKNGADVEAKDNKGRMPLHYAARNDSPAIIDLLLTSGTSVNATGWQGQTALHEAASCLVQSVVELLVTKGANASIQDTHGRTPLHVVGNWYGPESARKRQPALRRIVELLVAQGADVDAQDTDGWTPLHAATWASQDQKVQVLLTRGADVNAKTRKGATPLHHAACSFQFQKGVVETLIANGADVNAKTNAGETPLGMALQVNHQANHQQAIDLLIANGAEMPPTHALYAAARSGDLAEVKDAMGQGLGVNSAGQPEPTLLHAAAGAGQKKVVEFLVGSGADVTVKDRFGWTALHCAAYAGSKDVVQLLLAEGAEANTANEFGAMPLDMALARGDDNVAKVLLASGANTIQMDLFDAAQGGYISAATYLIRTGSDVDAQNESGETPLHYAVWSKHKQAALKIAELLLDRGANPDARDGVSFAPLHYAAGAANCTSEDMVKLLVRKGADVNRDNGWGDTPLSIAKKNGRADIAELLRRHGAKE